MSLRSGALPCKLLCLLGQLASRCRACATHGECSPDQSLFFVANAANLFVVMRKQSLRDIKCCFYFSLVSCIFFILCAFDVFDVLYSNAKRRFFLLASSNDLHLILHLNTTPQKSFARLKALHDLALLDNRTYAKSSEDDEVRIVGFFNLFERDGTLFQSILNEQLASIEASGILDQVTFIAYAYFGPNYLSFRMPSTSKKYFKSPISNASGNEFDTLQLLHEHCVRHPKDLAFYIHTKGSFHSRPVNDLLRKNLMKAVLSCVAESASLENIDVCGLRVSPVPYPQISGVLTTRLVRRNIFHTKCSLSGQRSGAGLRIQARS